RRPTPRPPRCSASPRRRWISPGARTRPTRCAASRARCASRSGSGTTGTRLPTACPTCRGCRPTVTCCCLPAPMPGGAPTARASTSRSKSWSRLPRAGRPSACRSGRWCWWTTRSPPRRLAFRLRPGPGLRPRLAQEAQCRRFPLAFAARLRRSALQRTVAPAGEHRRVDVGAAANGRRVAERGGHLLDHRLLQPGQRALAGEAAVGAVRQRGPRQPLEGRERAAPGAEVLGAEGVAGGLAQVVVDLARVHRHQGAVVVAVLEQRLPRELLAGAQQLHQALVVELHLVRLAGLAAEAEASAPAAHELDVAVAQRGQA